MTDDASTSHATNKGATNELRQMFKQLAQPVIENLDGRLREQVDKRVDERIDERVKELLDARLGVLERALSDLNRAVVSLEERLERSADATVTPVDDA